ncbi:trypsin-like peptidase domain-containing protein [Niveibacterium sp. 24ML]|uniref:S1C family serine protease n=1 Tax=Niveibacterium sp. 24ML TaxID=2985512 RepID=UPI00226DA1EF|nr:trypsin-like peptidase domain-containing protein [Niveibacterium sp. 24ML]MCX9157355.1 trypsin-like peptidase domain-containing protein [Niveibacterium sp. 24ML]
MTNLCPFLPCGSRLFAGAVLSVIVSLLPPQLLAGVSAAAAPRPVSPRGELQADEKATIALFERSRDAVAYITTSQRVRDLWSRNVFSVPRGSGSGFLWDQSGHVVTNYHVIEGASEATVRLGDGTDYRSTLVGASPEHDIAVLRIKLGKSRIAPIPLGSSHDLRVGQKVFAIGNPFGLDWTFTSGIVSALDRSLGEEGGRAIHHLIQTDAAINPGNSGGPLLDSAGRLIGINTMIYSPSGASAGIGFAVPADTLNSVVPELIRSGRYERPDLGLELDERVNARLSRMLDVRGVVVVRVERGSSADRAGLRGITQTPGGGFVAGDIITAVDGKPVDSVDKFQALLDDKRGADQVMLSVSRQGKVQRIAVRNLR